MEIIEQFLQKHRKSVLIIITAIIIGIIGYNIAVLISRIGKVSVTVMYAPFDAEVTINGEPYRNNQTYYLKPGNYDIKASREHFQTMTVTYTIEEGASTSNFIGELIPDDDEGFSIASERVNEFLQVESLGSADATNSANKLAEETPIIKFLPINFDAYSVSYKHNDQGEFFVELVLKKGINYGPQAVATLYNIDDDIDPASYKITVRDYDDPFGDFAQNTESDIAKYLETGYGENFAGYQVLTNRIINQENYYGILIIPKDANPNSDTSSYPIYRAILKKNGNIWQLVSTPYFVVSKYNATEVPTDFLNRLNRTFVQTDI